MADGKIIIETEVDSKAIDKWLNNLPKETKGKIDETQKQIETLSEKYGEVAEKYFELTSSAKGTPVFKSDQQEAEKLKKELQSIAKELSKITGDKIISIKGITDLDEATNKYSKNTVNNFKKMANQIKKFGLSLIGLRSIYALVSRASSAYLSVDTELAEKLKSVWVGLGSFLAPVLEMISNSLLTALGYLNVFIKALTGIDFLARANAKALKTQASAQKELNNQTYDFDVIRKQQDTSSSGGGGVSGSGDLFKIPELDENVVKKLQDLATWLKENKELVKALGIALLGVFGAVAVAKIIKGIATLLGAVTGTGLLGLASVLKGLLAIGVIAIGVSLLYTAMTGRDLIEDLKNIKIGIDELKKSTEANTRAEQTNTNSIKNQIANMKKAYDEGKLSNDLKKTSTDLLKDMTNAISDQIQTIENNTIKTKAMRDEEKILKEQLDEVIQGYEFLYDNQQLSEDEMYDYIRAIDQQIRIMKTLGEDTTDLEAKYRSLTGKDWTLQLNARDNTQSTFDKIKNKILELLGLSQDLNNNLSHGGSSGFGHGGGSGRHFALGGIVTQPTRALIGEAGYPEAVVPMTADYLSTLAGEIAKYGGGRGNQPINIYLDGRLIQRQNANVTNQKNFLMNR